MTAARYDGHADWYDENFKAYSSEDGSAGLLAELLGEADPSRAELLDVGCGTGLHFAAVEARGYSMTGVDLSADQIRIASRRNPNVRVADARELPFSDGSFDAVTMTFIHTDVDGWDAAVSEAARMLRPGGRLVYVGVHPAYVGAYLDRSSEAADGSVRFVAGYGDESLHRDPTGRFSMRSRVGSRYLTLSTFLGAFLARPTLRLTGFREYGTTMAPWSADSTDGRVFPWHVSVVAERMA